MLGPLGDWFAVPGDVSSLLRSCRLSQPAVPRTNTHAEKHTDYTHLAASVVRIAAESCEAKTLIKTTDHFLLERERRGRRGVI